MGGAPSLMRGTARLSADPLFSLTIVARSLQGVVTYQRLAGGLR